MRNLFLFGALLLLMACTSGKFETAPDDANVYIVDSAVVSNSYVVFQLRDVEDLYVAPITKCLDGIEYPRGTVVIINEDAYVSKINKMVSTESLMLVTAVGVIGLIAVYLIRRKLEKPKK